MRLVCPNCGAQYEVDDRVIPDSGRDVQCSSCGHAWYQMPAGVEAAEAPLPDEIADEIADETEDGFGAEDESDDFEPEAGPDPEPEPEPETEPEPEPDTEEAPVVPAEAATEDATPSTPAAPEAPAADENADENGDDDDEDEEDEDAGPPPSVEGVTPPKRDLDQNLRAILQEEVAREMAARASDTGQTVIETPLTPGGTDTPAEDTSDLELIRDPSQPSDDDTLPDSGADVGPAPTPDRVDVFAAAPDVAAAPDRASRKDLFPDIEEINSTLDSHGLEDEDEDETDADERSGFSRAFLTVIAIAALLLALYLAAPKLAASVPALEPALSAYVGAINGLRGMFSGLI
ncbi:MAG: zinc-ribbon domain-containing protein [Maritimibacter sp.]|nr:zinc-ribbon domain-containing protein [Maritimibacter sp.]